MSAYFYVFDLDGTLADNSARFATYLAGPNKDWIQFCAESIHDKPITHTIAVMHALIFAGAEVEIWTARSEEARIITKDWLIRYGINPKHLTFMREIGDHRDDDLVKRDFLKKSYRRPAIVFEDRQRVVDMWRAEGIPCFQVNAVAF